MLPEKILQTIASYNMIQPGETVVVGVSGGPDSLCLLHILRILAAQLNLILHASHLHHGIRGQTADDDARFVAELCADWQVACTVERSDVPAMARIKRLSLEEAARQARYAFLAQVARSIDARVVAVGHNADDQVETILMHFLRGAGLSGLRGMLPVSDLNGIVRTQARGTEAADAAAEIHLVRPLLQVSRQEIEAYCREQNLAPRQDTTNLDTSLFRNRLRHELLPILEQYNPNIRERLQHTAEVVTGDMDVLAAVTAQVWRQIVLGEAAGTVTVDLPALRALPSALQRAIIKHAINYLCPDVRDVTFVRIENALNIVNKGVTGSRVTLPGNITLELSYHQAYLSAVKPAPATQCWPCYSLPQPIEIPIPGCYINESDGWRLECRVIPRCDWSPQPDDRHSACLALETVTGPLMLGTRRPGDVIHPLGMHGLSQKLHDLMINAKVPARQRATIPVLRQGSQVIWVVGLRLDENLAVTAATTSIVYLQFTPL